MDLVYAAVTPTESALTPYEISGHAPSFVAAKSSSGLPSLTRTGSAVGTGARGLPRNVDPTAVAVVVNLLLSQDPSKHRADGVLLEVVTFFTSPRSVALSWIVPR